MQIAWPMTLAKIVISFVFVLSCEAYGIEYSSEVSADHTRTLEAALNLDLGKVPNEFATLVGLERGETIKSWVFKRVKYVVASHERFNGRCTAVAPQEYPFPNLGIPDRDLNTKMADTDFLANPGSIFYLYGKNKRKLYKYVFSSKSGDVDILIKSPRVGILQIGPNFSFSFVDDTGSIANVINHLSGLIHEARHGDGHATSLTFDHVYCKSGDFAGSRGCDKFSNGPYTIEREFLTFARAVCLERGDCTEGEAERIAYYATYFGERVIDNVWGDPAPESL